MSTDTQNRSEPDTLEVRSLRVGEPMPTDLTDAHGVLLLRAGVEITQGFIDLLTRRGIKTVATRRSDDTPASEPAQPEPAKRVAQKSADRPRSASAKADPRPRFGPQRLAPDPRKSPPPEAVPTTATGDLHYEAGSAPAGRLSLGELSRMTREAERDFDRSMDAFLGLAPELYRGDVTDLGGAHLLVQQFHRYLHADPSLVLHLLRMKGDPGRTLYRHGIKAALLSMTLTRQLGLDEDRVTHAGVAALVHDLGMLRVPKPIRFAPRPLTRAEWQQVQEHPTHTLNLLDKLGGVNDSIKTAAYQVHERCDATGYPKQRSKQFIHPLAKVIALADSYAALTDDRPHRAALSGHEAMKTLLREVQAGKHDRGVARALVDTMSMYPVGSLVGLSDGRTARVLRGVPGQSIRPVVVVLKDGEPVDWELDLGEIDDLSITRVLGEEQTTAA
ncbi:MAG: HD domain-containing phosphohydrolase [Planctomycetota bacterium]